VVCDVADSVPTDVEHMHCVPAEFEDVATAHSSRDARDLAGLLCRPDDLAVVFLLQLVVSTSVIIGWWCVLKMWVSCQPRRLSASTIGPASGVSIAAVTPLSGACKRKP